MRGTKARALRHIIYGDGSKRQRAYRWGDTHASRGTLVATGNSLIADENRRAYQRAKRARHEMSRR